MRPCGGTFAAFARLIWDPNNHGPERFAGPMVFHSHTKMVVPEILDGAWRLLEVLKFGGVTVAVAGVGVFGWNFVTLNARAAKGETSAVPSDSWRGKPARLGFVIFATGVAMQMFGYALGVFLPFRT